MNIEKKGNIEDEKKSLMDYSIDRFILGHFNSKKDESQSLDKSERDRQTDIINSIISGHVNSDTILVDFGCGETGNLFFNIPKTLSEEKIKKITYYGISRKILFEEIKQNNFYDLVNQFNNEDKTIEGVFIEDTSPLNNIDEFDKIEQKIKKADLVIIKNVIHEIELIELPFFIYKIFKILKEDKPFVFFDMVDLLDGEEKRFPWHFEDYRYLFNNHLNCEIIDHLDYHDPSESPIRKGRGEHKRKTPLLLVEIKKTNQVEKISLSELKRISMKFYRERSDNFIKYKNKMLENEPNSIYMENFIRKSIYHSNYIEQIEEAQKAWECEIKLG